MTAVCSCNLVFFGSVIVTKKVDSDVEQKLKLDSIDRKFK